MPLDLPIPRKRRIPEPIFRELCRKSARKPITPISTAIARMWNIRILQIPCSRSGIFRVAFRQTPFRRVGKWGIAH